MQAPCSVLTYLRSPKSCTINATYLFRLTTKFNVGVPFSVLGLGALKIGLGISIIVFSKLRVTLISISSHRECEDQARGSFAIKNLLKRVGIGMAILASQSLHPEILFK